MEGSAARKHLANLGHPDGSVRHKATLALGSGVRHRDWAPDLLAGVTKGSPDVRFWAAMALQRASPDPAQAVPALIGLLSDPDRFGNRQVAAGALATIGRPAARDAVPALARVLDTDDNHFVRQDAVRALKTLAVWNPDAISVLIHALEDPHERVRSQAIQSCALLGVRAGDAVPALRRLAENGDETEHLRSDASSAIERVLSGAAAYRQDEPYRSLSEAVSKSRFIDASVADQVRVHLEEENFRGAFRLLEAGIERDQEKDVWLQMSLAARELDLPVAAHYHDRYMTALGTGGFWPELAGVVRSTCTVATGMRRIIRYCSRADPNPRWKLFDKLKIDEDLLRLRAWLETAFTEDPPADDVPGLWFGLIDVDRDGQPSFDMHLSGGHPDDEQPDDLVIGGSWEPRDEFAHSGVLDQIHKIAHAKEGRELKNAEYHLTLAYGALAVRRLAMTLNPELLLGGAPRRVLAVGFHDGDSIGVGTLRPDGLAFPDE
jgi:hypothetical protein